jgi:hypothetical protein
MRLSIEPRESGSLCLHKEVRCSSGFGWCSPGPLSSSSRACQQNKETMQQNSLRSALYTWSSVTPQGSTCQAMLTCWTVPLRLNRSHVYICCVHTVVYSTQGAFALTLVPSNFSLRYKCSLRFWQMFHLRLALGLWGPDYQKLSSFCVSLSPLPCLCFLGVQ